jgi:hypothetical protein
LWAHFPNCLYVVQQENDFVYYVEYTKRDSLKTTSQIFSCLHHYLSITAETATKYTEFAPKPVDKQKKHVIIAKETGDLYANQQANATERHNHDQTNKRRRNNRHA